eukprot:TRINITY_DN2858_c0_g1_i1.p1 TRINITY_DN2858_c0_g1~~TRINITY_DN2858_c0_g1_i1.p1  ORF type:complete len:896 (-),score=215.12 TRINITY_DN2858_c0_g1_i1:33-2720(-)
MPPLAGPNAFRPNAVVAVPEAVPTGESLLTAIEDAAPMNPEMANDIALRPPPSEAVDAPVVPDDPPPQESATALVKERQQQHAAAAAAANFKPIESILKTDDFAVDVQNMAEGDEQLRRMLRVAARTANAKDSKLVPKEDIVAYIREESKRRNACLNIPFIIAYFFVSSMMIMVHEQTADLSQVEREFRGMLEGTGFEGYGGPVVSNTLPVSGHKTMDDIDTVDDIYTYLQDAVIPVYLMPNGTRWEDQTRVLSFNNLIGGLQLIQIRKGRVSCSKAYPNAGPKNYSRVNPFLESFDCFPEDSLGDECYGPGAAVPGFCPLSSVRPERRRLNAAAHTTRNRVGAKAKRAMQGAAMGSRFSVTMHSHEGSEKAIDILKTLQDNVWLDEQTAQLVIRLFVMNPDLGIFSKVDVNVFFAPSGEIVPFISSSTFLADPYNHGVFIWILDILFLILWIHVCILALKNYNESRKAGESAFGHLTHPWYAIEWLTAAGGLMCIIVWIVYILELDKLKERTMDVVQARPQSLTPSAAALLSYENKCDDLSEHTADFCDFLETLRWILGSYIIFLMLRFFKAFEAQPRLAVITQTVVGSQSDFVHFFLVFMSMFWAFAVASMFIFGHRMVQFSSPWFAFCECFEVLLGNFDWGDLGEEYPLTAFLWFIGFMILIFNIMLNMILAILMDVYGAAKQNAALSDPMWTQASNMLIHYKVQVPLTEILHILEHTDKELMGPNSLMEAVPNMGEEQSHNIIDAVENIVKNEDEQGLSLSDAARLIVAIRSQVATIAVKLDDIRGMQAEGKSLQRAAPEITKKVLAAQRAAAQPTRVLVEKLDPNGETQVRSVEGRMRSLEAFLNEAMSYIIFRGKEYRNRCATIEEHLKAQRDMSSLGPGETTLPALTQ